MSNSEAILALTNIPDLQIVIWSWKSGGQLLAKIDLLNRATAPNSYSSFLPIPEHVCFSPMNWRHLMCAYKNDIHVYQIEHFDSQRYKTTLLKHFRLPTKTNDQQNHEQSAIDEDDKDEFLYPLRAIAHLDEAYTSEIEAQIDKSERHEFRTVCWSSSDEILIASKENYVFKLSLLNIDDHSTTTTTKSNSIQLVFMPNDVSLEDEAKHEFNLRANNNYINRMHLHRNGLFVSLSVNYNFQTIIFFRIANAFFSFNY